MIDIKDERYDGRGVTCPDLEGRLGNFGTDVPCMIANLGQTTVI